MFFPPYCPLRTNNPGLVKICTCSCFAKEKMFERPVRFPIEHGILIGSNIEYAHRYMKHKNNTY